MDTSMKLLSILVVLLRWAIRGDDGGDPVADASLPAGSILPR